MAERRMFSKTVIDSDLFLEMPLSTQALYFHLAMRADDDGFISNPRKLSKMIGADDDSLKLLIMKRFLIPFDTGVVVIRHWKLHNYIQKDRYKETIYTDEKSLLELPKNGIYKVLDTECIQDVSSLSPQVSIGKESIGKDNIYVPTKVETNSDKKKRFVKPTVEEVRAYCQERKNNIDPETFFDFYEANGWVQGKAGKPIKDWKAAIRTWERSNFQRYPSKVDNKLHATEEDIDAYSAALDRNMILY